MRGRRRRSAAATAARTSGVRDPRVLAALDAVDRGDFVVSTDRDVASVDRPLRIGHGQTTSQPSLIAAMVEALELQGDERVLEIGTGLGYQAAILGQLAAEVVTVERVGDLADEARRNLQQAGIGNVEVRVGDGSRLAPEDGSFDAAIIAAVAPTVPAPVIERIVDGGHLVAPISESGTEEAVRFDVEDGQLRRVRRVAQVRFVPLIVDDDA